ncbi:recombinase family protein [bacterium]|jgi:DNA invertase Pin-like site-specific DNA recombinase|nr:recombinase family protein [bacterium]
MTTKVALYCRVSTSTDKHGQTTENQWRELTAYCDRMDYQVTKIYEDQISGAKTREKRPAYNELCKDAFLKKFDVVIAWDVSRFGRSLKEFVSFLADMDDKGIGVVAVKNGLDTSSSTGKMMMKMIGVMEEWNREMLVERTKSGLARTVANGTKLGRKKITNPRMTAQIISLRNENKSIRAIATMVGVSTATIQRELRKVA